MKQIFGICSVLLLCAAMAGAATFENNQLLDLELQSWSGTGAAVDGVADQGTLGVDYDVTLATSDYGKLAMNKDAPLDWTGETNFYLKVELLSASGASQSIELNPFVKTGSGWTFYEDKDGVALGVGDSYVIDWDLTSVPDLNDVRGYGFQLFTAGGVADPEAMDAVVRVTPIPEPVTLSLLAAGGACVAMRRRRA
jgi:hypothetical protein